MSDDVPTTTSGVLSRRLTCQQPRSPLTQAEPTSYHASDRLSVLDSRGSTLPQYVVRCLQLEGRVVNIEVG